MRKHPTSTLNQEAQESVVFEVLTDRELRRFDCQRYQTQKIYNKLIWGGQRIRGWLITPKSEYS